MNKLILIFILLLTACAPSLIQKEEQLSLTPAMLSAMAAHADEFDGLYPNSENVARICSQNNSDVYWNKDLKSYAVTCFLPSGGIGIVTFSDQETLIDVFSMICRARRKTPIEYPRNYSNAWKTSSKMIDESRFTVVQLTQQELIELEADLTNVSEDKP